VTVVIATALPPAPEQVSEYVESCGIGPTLCEPDVAFVPLQAPDALQPVVFALDHVSVVEPFSGTPCGFADSVAVGDPAVTVTEAVFEVLPPEPVHVSV